MYDAISEVRSTVSEFGHSHSLSRRMRPLAWLAVLATPGLLHAQAAPELLRSYFGSGGLGWAVADIADLDGDGHRDFIAGANSSGSVVAYSSANSTPLWSATLSLNSFGWSVSGTGDINADGVSDVISGAPNAPGGGAVRVLSGANGEVLLNVPRPDGASQFGYAVNSLDDRNGDSVPDLLVGASGGSGNAYLISGADGSVIRSHLGLPGSEFGAGIARLSDLDGDGVLDYVVGAPVDGNGKSFVYSGASGNLLFTLAAQLSGRFGDSFVADAGDVDADGLADIYVGAYAESNNRGAAYVFSGRTGARLFVIPGTTGEGLGPGRGVGDVDGDGHADLVVGSYSFGGAGVSQGGRASVFSGADRSVLMRVNGSRNGGQFGFDAVGLGDVNGDGRLDFIVSSSPASTVELFSGVITRPLIPAGAGLNHSFTYWNSQQPGWGFNVLHQGQLVYGTWYSYAEDGQVMFLTVEATLQDDGSYSGPIYRIAGTPFAQINNAQAFTAVNEVGSARLLFSAGGQLTLNYEAFGVSQSKSLERFVFGANAPTCFGASPSRVFAENYSDLWWSDREPGWGLTLAHQGGVIFVLWYTYGDGGRDQWLSASTLLRQADGSFSGALQRPLSGTPLTQISGAATNFPVPEVGSASLHFSDGENGIFSYSLEGVTQSKRIKRFVVVGGDQPKPVCVP